MKKVVYLFLAGLLLCVQASGEDVSPAYMPPSEQGAVRYLDKKTLRKRADLNFSLTRIPGSQPFRYELLRKGSGDCDKYKEITWTNSAEMEESGGFIRNLK